MFESRAVSLQRLPYQCVWTISVGQAMRSPSRCDKAMPSFTISWILALHVAVGLAQSTGTFTPTGKMTRPRQDHTATLLLTGKVLIAGGSDLYSTTWVSAELYDPATQTFTATVDMTSPRQAHSATLLPNGKVLIVGGFNSSGRLASAELYDAETGTFHATGAVPRFRHTATLLNNGKVLIAG